MIRSAIGWAGVIVLSLLIVFIYLSKSDDQLIGVLALAMLGSGVVATIVLDRPVWGILMTMSVLHWVQVEDMGYTTPLTSVALLIQFAYSYLNHPQNNRKIWPIIILVFSYNLFILAVRPYPIIKLWFFLYMEALILFAWTQTIRWDKLLLERFLLGHGLFMVIYGILERLLTGVDRVDGPTMSSTAYAVLIAVIWTIWFVNSLIGGKMNWVYLASGTLLVFICIILSGTRMGVLGMGLGFIAGFVCRALALQSTSGLNKIIRATILLAISSVLVFVFWSIIPSDSIVKKGLMGLLSGKMDVSSLGRIAAWATALDTIPKHWFWGIGPGNFLQYNEAFLANLPSLPLIDQIPRLGHAHNIYLIILCEHGVLGFAMISGVVGLCLYRLITFIRRNPTNSMGYALLCGGIVLAALGCLDAIPLFPSTVGWGAWFMGVMAGLGTLDNERGI